MKRSNHLTRLLKVLIEEFGAGDSFWEKDLSEAVCLYVTSSAQFPLQLIVDLMNKPVAELQ